MDKKFVHNRRRRPQGQQYKPQGDPAALAKPVEELKLRENTLAALKAGGVKTAQDLARRREREMYKVQNIGKRDIFEIKKALEGLGLGFRKEEEAPRREETAARTEGAKPQREKSEKGPSLEKSVQKKKSAEGEKKKPFPERRENRPEGEKNAGRGGKKNADALNRELSRLYAGMTINEIIMGGKKRRPAFIPYPKEGIKQGDLIKFYRAGKWGYKDWKGNVIISPQYDEAFPFRGDRAGVEENGLIGYIDKKNNKVIECKYDCGTSFSEGLAAVSMGDKSGYIDENGEEVTGLIYDVATPFCEGKAVVRADDRWGVLDRQTLKVLWR